MTKMRTLRTMMNGKTSVPHPPTPSQMIITTLITGKENLFHIQIINVNVPMIRCIFLLPLSFFFVLLICAIPCLICKYVYLVSYCNNLSSFYIIVFSYSLSWFMFCLSSSWWWILMWIVLCPHPYFIMLLQNPPSIPQIDTCNYDIKSSLELEFIFLV